MIFGKYNVVLIKEKTGKTRTLKIRGGLLFSLFLLISALAAGNIYLFQSVKSARGLEEQLVEADRLLDERQNQLVAMAADAMSVKDNLARMQQFNSKLRLMIDMESEPLETGLGGSQVDELDLGVLPLHRQELASRKIRIFLKNLAAESTLEEVHQQELLLAMRSSNNLLASMPTIIPVEGFITSPFGRRSSPFTSRTETHSGLDIAAQTGTPIYAPARGTVNFKGVSTGYGNTIEISHGSGITTKYAHLSKFNVEDGQKVERYDIIGYVGSTGRSTGPHLHYEVRVNGVPTDPMLYVLNQ